MGIKTEDFCKDIHLRTGSRLCFAEIAANLTRHTTRHSKTTGKLSFIDKETGRRLTNLCILYIIIRNSKSSKCTLIDYIPTSSQGSETDSPYVRTSLQPTTSLRVRWNLKESDLVLINNPYRNCRICNDLGQTNKASILIGDYRLMQTSFVKLKISDSVWGGNG